MIGLTKGMAVILIGLFSVSPTTIAKWNIQRTVVVISHQPAMGTGVIINEKGDVLTCAHVIHLRNFKERILGVQECSPYTTIGIYTGKKIIKIDGKVIAINFDKDLAVIRLAGKVHTHRFVHISGSNFIRIGDPVVAIGHPFGLLWTVTNGIISQIRLNGFLIQTNTVINPGNSGGPLFNSRGQLIGINEAILPQPFFVGQGFAISVKTIKEFLNENKIRYYRW